MDTTMVAITCFSVFLSVAMLLGLFVLKGGNAHAAKLAHEQELLNRKNGKSAPDQIASGGTNGGKFPGWFTSKLGLNILFILVGVVLVFWSSSNAQIRPADAGSWGQQYWLPLLIIWSIGAALIAFNAGELKAAASVLQFTLAGAMLMLFIALPIIGWFGGSNSPKTNKVTTSMQVRALPNDAPNLPRAWLADGSTSDMTKWPRVLVPPHGDSVPVPSVAGGHIVWGGSGFKTRYRYSDGHECGLGDTSSSCGDGNIVEGYARNEGDTPLYASYAYANKDEK